MQAEKLSLNQAFLKSGGFGRFQLLALVLICLIRNLGMYHVYGFSVLTTRQDYKCSFSAQGSTPITAERCSHELICKYRENPSQLGTSFDYWVDSESPSYFFNWFVSEDLMC